MSPTGILNSSVSVSNVAFGDTTSNLPRVGRSMIDKGCGHESGIMYSCTAVQANAGAPPVGKGADIGIFLCARR